MVGFTHYYGDPKPTRSFEPLELIISNIEDSARFRELFVLVVENTRTLCQQECEVAAVMAALTPAVEKALNKLPATNRLRAARGVRRISKARLILRVKTRSRCGCNDIW